jgi:hypothetical protein
VATSTAQAGRPTGGPPTDFAGQFGGAFGDIWATGWGAYTGKVIDHHLPDSKFGGRVAAANTIIAWLKTILTVARQKIEIEVENVPLERTKTRSPGQQRHATATVVIDFPKSDIFKALRMAGNLTTVDLQVPDGGAVSGAKVVWRLPQGSYNSKYQTAGGGWAYRPDLAVVQFAARGGTAAYVSYTDDAGRAHITIEGAPQRRELPPNVRPFPRQAAVAVEVTIKVGNLTQDLNDAINLALGGPVAGGLNFLADMVLRTSFFFQRSLEFPVTDWREPQWYGEFTITARAAGSKTEKSKKSGEDVTFDWSVDRKMEGRMQTPDYEEEHQREQRLDYGRRRLEVTTDSRWFRVNDRSRQRGKEVEARYTVEGPVQLRPPGRNQLALYSRAEPSGDVELILDGRRYTIELRPFFAAQVLRTHHERNRGRVRNEGGVVYFNLIDGLGRDTFFDVGNWEPATGLIQGSKTFEVQGSLPHVPPFPLTITVDYALRYDEGPPPDRPRR